ncbi:hypothetical protein JKY79_03680 [Candidatus Babeliales bacterium]|nr:hypothetical protein [Candidatus Babeliales bacterium]
MFELGDNVFFPGHGVAVLEERDEKKILDKIVKVMKLVFKYKDQIVWLPAHTIKQSGLRYLSSEQEIADAFSELNLVPERPFESMDFTPSGWSRRHKRCQALMQTGVLRNLMKIYRDFMYITKQKELSFGEKALLTLVEDLIVQEVITVRGVEKEQIIQELKTPFMGQEFSGAQPKEESASL